MRVKSQPIEDLARRGLVHQQTAEVLPAKQRHALLRSASLVEAPEEQSWLAFCIFHHRFETFGGFVVLFNFMIMTMETNAEATEDDSSKEFVHIANKVLLLYYTLECAARLYVSKKYFFAVSWNILDLTIVITGWIGEIMEMINFDGSGLEQMAMLKSLRILRMLRLVRLVVAFRELYVLVAGIGRCMQTLCWASALIFLILNIWAILSVEFLDGRVKKLVPTGSYAMCGWCEHAFSNIWQANLTWFQIVSTTDWAAIGRPLAEEFVWPYAFFILNIFVVLWGLLNLIVAAIIESNLAARDEDIHAAASNAAKCQDEAWASFATLCKGMQEDVSGEIEIQQFKEFLKGSDLLKQHLTIMGLREGDVDELLELMDDTGNGRLAKEEFIANFTRMRTLVEKTSLFFLLKFAKDIREKLTQQNESLRRMWQDIHRASEWQGAPRASGISCDSGSDIDKPFEEASSVSGVSRTMPDGKGLPHGWYYFGSRSPTAVEAYQTLLGPSDEAHAPSDFAPDDLFSHKISTVLEDISRLAAHGVSLATRGSIWEPVAMERLPVELSTSSQSIPPTPMGRSPADLTDGVVQHSPPARDSESSKELSARSLQIHDVHMTLRDEDETFRSEG